jgi:hypothetical protein
MDLSASDWDDDRLLLRALVKVQGLGDYEFDPMECEFGPMDCLFLSLFI